MFQQSGLRFAVIFSQSEDVPFANACEGEQMDISVQILTEQQQHNIYVGVCDPLHTGHAITCW